MRLAPPAVLAALVVLGGTRAARADDPPSYTKDIRPFLDTNCVSCHNAKVTKGGANLESYESIVKGGKNKKVLLVPGDADKTRLVAVIEHKAKPNMPPKKEKQQPTDAEKTMFRAWVAAGAKDDSAKGDAGKDKPKDSGTNPPAGQVQELPPRVELDPIMLVASRRRPSDQ
jgi:hypothetical protein